MKDRTKIYANKIAGRSDEIDGAYAIKHPKVRNYYFQIIASTGMGWEHVSVTLRMKDNPKFVERTPTWQEMCFIKSVFWNDHEAVMQLHPPISEYVNNHPFCLHLWRPTQTEIPLPDSLLVGIKDKT